ncbi:glycoside hydrolase family 127 protein [Acidobacteria bacterium AH-259-G07]|nr:glycoside hydrolase family 127 protein [Acidobacteria bacterium AH-259-G07]
MKPFQHHLCKAGCLFAVVGFALLLASSCSTDQIKSVNSADLIPLEPIDLHRVRVGGEIGRRVDLTIRENFFALDVDKDFLQPFRHRRPRLEVKGHDRFTGLGLLIHAAVLFAKSTSDSEVIARKDHIIAETIAAQSPDGYIGVFEPEPRAAHLWGEWCFHDAAYIVLGLVEDFRQFGNDQSLEVGRKLAEYLMTNWSRRPRDAIFTTLGTAEAFLSLYQVTGDRRYLDFAADEKMGKKYRIVPNALRTWEQEIYVRRRLDAGAVDSCHMYRMFSRSMMQLRLYHLEPAENLLVMSRRLLNMMTRPQRSGMLITGVCGLSESWHENQDGRGRIGENCATAYELLFLDEVLRLEGDLRYGDIMERAIYNTLFASQDPKGRRVCYFTPFSGKRGFFDRDTFCCPNNFKRGMGSLPKLVYYQSNSGVVINLYTTSTAELDLSGGLSVEVRQETDYPNSGRVEIALKPSAPARFSLRMRIPRWCTRATVAVNGTPVNESEPGARYFQIVRDWGPGDKITLDMPMPWRFIKGRGLQAGRAALMRGPLVYCLNPQRSPGLERFELRDITLDLDSLEGPRLDDSVQSAGLACRIKAWSPGRSLNEPTDLDLVLTQFPDPGGEEIYFRLSNPTSAVDDELID